MSHMWLRLLLHVFDERYSTSNSQWCYLNGQTDHSTYMYVLWHAREFLPLFSEQIVLRRQNRQVNGTIRHGRAKRRFVKIEEDGD